MYCIGRDSGCTICFGMLELRGREGGREGGGKGTERSRGLGWWVCDMIWYGRVECYITAKGHYPIKHLPYRSMRCGR